MKARVLAAAAVLACVITTATGCFAQPDPEPTPLFSSEEEAFAAAEATYRAYVDALNQVDLSDPETFEEVYAWTTGDFNADERKSFSQLHADMWSVSGTSEVVRVEKLDATTGFATVDLGSCLDVSTVALVDGDGVSKVDPSRPDVQATRVSVVEAEESPTGYLIEDIVGFELEPPCTP
ncbi:hypothetical protein [Microbacterium sp. P5_E9]